MNNTSETAHQITQESFENLESLQFNNRKSGQRKTSLEDIIEFVYSNFDIRKNIISQDYEFKAKEDKDFKELNLSDIWIECHRNNHTGATPEKIKNIIKSSQTADYNPFLDYLENLPQWDGFDYFEKLATYLNTHETDKYKFVYHFKKWFVRMIRCMIDEKYFNKNMIVLVQEEQNGGKSFFCRWLVPNPLLKYYTETIVDGKDEDIQLTTNFLICYDELSKLTNASIENIKSLMSRSTVNVRMPYEAKQSTSYRRCSFIGNTNSKEFITDETGTIRFICFELLSKINFAYAKEMNTDDLYAQAYYLYKSQRFDYEISNLDSAQIQEYNKRFFVVTSEIDLIRKYFRKPTDEEIENESAEIQHLSTTEVLQELNRLSNLKLNLNKVGKGLRFLGYKYVSKWKKTMGVYGYYICLNHDVE